MMKPTVACLIIVLAACAAMAQQRPPRAPPSPRPPRAPVSPRPPAPPRTDPCSSTGATELSASLTDSINAALAPYYGKSAGKTTTGKTSTIDVGGWCGPYDWDGQICIPKNTYTASTSRTSSVTGATNIVANVVVTQTSCSLTSTGYTANGTMSITLTWTTPVKASVNWQATGWLGVNVYATLTTSINGLSVDVPGTFSVGSTNNGTTSTVSSASVANCTVATSSVSATLGAKNVPAISLVNVQNTIEKKIDGQGPALCASINDALSKDVTGTTI